MKLHSYDREQNREFVVSFTFRELEMIRNSQNRDRLKLCDDTMMFHDKISEKVLALAGICKIIELSSVDYSVMMDMIKEFNESYV